MLVIETYNAGGLQISVARSDSSYMEGMKPVSLIVAFQKILKGNRMRQNPFPVWKLSYTKKKLDENAAMKEPSPWIHA